MKKLFLLLFGILIFSHVSAQIQGVSNDKLIVVGPESIATRTIEFEPGFGYIWSTQSFDSDGKLVPLDPRNDSILVLQALAFRITYGFAKNFEIGTLITASLDAFSLGIKYTFIKNERFWAGTFLGTNFANESDLAFRNTGLFGQAAALVGGFVFMNRFGESKRLSMDYEIQYQNTFDRDQIFSDDIFAAWEIGYEFKKKVQLISGFNYRFHSFRNNPNSWLLTWNTGVTVHPGESFNLIANIPFDIAGRNSQRFMGFQIVLTIALD